MYPCNRDAEVSSGTAVEHVLRTMTCHGCYSDILSRLITTVQSGLSWTKGCWMQTDAPSAVPALKLTSVSPPPSQTVEMRDCVLAWCFCSASSSSGDGLMWKDAATGHHISNICAAFDLRYLLP